MAPIRLAIFGSGHFIRGAHLPVLKNLSDTYQVVAIYSHNPTTAGELAAMLPGKVDIYTDMAAALARADVDAVDIAVPIALLPEIVIAALGAGKHVISEKPVAPDVAIGRRLLETARELTGKSGRIWSVGENWRYEPAYHAAGDAIRRGDIGRPIQFNWAASAGITRQSVGYKTTWRRDNSYPGGFLLDGGVHNIAAIRLIMGEVESVSAFVMQVNPDFPPSDTLSATFQFDSGAFGTLTMTFGTQAPWDSPAQVLGDSGALRVSSKQLELFKNGQSSSQAFNVDAVQAEFAEFARVINGETLRNTPEQALQDVAVIHAILESARTGCAVQPERIV